MAKPKYVYHGSGRKLKGDKLIPKKAADLGNIPDNLLAGVYASGIKEEAIAMGILSCNGVKSSSCGIYKRQGIKVKAVIYDGWPKQDYFYLYTLPSITFEDRPKGSSQYVSLTPVKPEKIERLAVKNYIYLVRRATYKERKEWFKKYKYKIEKNN